MSTDHWHAKLAAWTHDPAEKALVLLRDPTGHERGTVAALRQAIFGQPSIPANLEPIVRKADHWASAADRPQWPRDERDGRYASWAQVRFTEQPVLKHPLSGEDLHLRRLPDIGVDAIKAVSFDHFNRLLDKDGDAKRSALAFWRFGPDRAAVPDLGHLWGLLPADTRVPDHSIWQHLDLTAAFATAFYADPEDNPALLSVSVGPVQDFIAQARTTSDLWAGSHLLARIAWEAMRVVCDAYGPDTVLFPQLRGVPQVDLWLRDPDEVGLPAELFLDEPWAKGATDANPLFTAALPNRFVALVPAAAAEELAKTITREVREWVIAKADQALDLLLQRAHAGQAGEAREQIRAQLDGFPEVHWAVVPWGSFIHEREGQAPDTSGLREALGVFYPKEAKQGFLDSKAWHLLSRELTVEGQRLYLPNPGTLYPALYDLLERAQAAAKSVRSFQQLPQEGYRCSLCGEREWLTHDRVLLQYSPRQQQETFWASVQGRGLARKGEHLCAPCTLKRVWPSLFAAEAGEALRRTGQVGRYVVSTHTMALATSLERWLEKTPRPALPARWLSHLEGLSDQATVALPRRLARHLTSGADRETRAMLRGLPLFLEKRKEELESPEEADREQASRLAEDLSKELEKDIFGHRPEAYYGLILMDGDRMGAWLSGQGEQGEAYRLPFETTWHPQLRNTLRARHPAGDLADYLHQRRPVSPARHMAISSALNGFALHLARHVVEEIGKGKLIYAGGDDVLAMVSVDDLLPVMYLLRLTYSGIFPDGPFAERARDLLGIDARRFDLRRGHVRLDGQLLRVMGHRATASMGAVVAHHQAPLGQVLRKLREAEQSAKREGGRDAFAVSLLKRSGGAVHLTCPWLARAPDEEPDWPAALEGSLEETPMGQLIRLRERFGGPGLSRRAAYITQGWLADIPVGSPALSAMLGYQLRRQTQGSDADKKVAESIGRAVAELALAVYPAPGPGEDFSSATRERPARVRSFVEAFLGVAEFLGREGRVRNAV